MKYNLPYPDVTNRRPVFPFELHRGSVVAFAKKEFHTIRTGIIVMDNPQMMLVAVNMYDQNDDGMCYMDELPEKVALYAANEEEKLWGLKTFMKVEYGDIESNKVKNPFVLFVDKECPKEDNEYFKMRFCKDMLSIVPEFVDQSKWTELRKELTGLFKQTGGLQFNRFQAEYYCFLIGVLMIAEYENDTIRCKERIDLLIREWDQFSWMYGIGVGRVIGSKLHNFTAVINQTVQSDRKHYLHLYLPLAERFFDKMLDYNDDKPDKLRAAIDKARMVEEREEQKTNLDELFRILFPKPFRDAMSSNRPAPTIARMKKEMADKECRIKELESAVDGLTVKYKEVMKQLTEAVKDVESDKITADDLIAAFLRFPTDLALSLYGGMSTLLALNSAWQKYAPVINEKILGRVQEQQNRQQELEENMKKAANKPTTLTNLTLELVQKKETNIENNYAPNIEHNGGTLSLPDKGQ